MCNSSRRNEQDSPLLRLPAELCNKIYEYVNENEAYVCGWDSENWVTYFRPSQVHCELLEVMEWEQMLRQEAGRAVELRFEYNLIDYQVPMEYMVKGGTWHRMSQNASITSMSYCLGVVWSDMVLSCSNVSDQTNSLFCFLQHQYATQ